MYKGILKLKNATTGEIVTAAEVKVNSRIDSVTYTNDITQTNSINPAVYTTGTQTGTGVDISGAGEIIGLLPLGAVAAGATLTAHLEESDDNVTYTSVTGSTFTVATTGYQNTTLEKAYTGNKQYIRGVAINEVASVTYGLIIQEKTPASDEDTWIEDTITAVRQYSEKISDRTFRTADYYYYLQKFPEEDYIELPRAPLQTVNSITYKDNDGTITTLSSCYYNYDINSEPARIYLDYGESWPSFTEYPFNAVTIDFTAGSTTLAKFKEDNRDLYQWNLAAVGKLYENREMAIEDIKPAPPRRMVSF